MFESQFYIQNVQRLDEGIIVDFSDGTTCLYTAEELKTIRPVWELVTDEDWQYKAN